MSASRNIAIIRRVGCGVGNSSSQERSLHAITSNEMLLPTPPPPSSSSSSSQSRPFFVASSSSAMDTHIHLLESSLPCRNKPSAKAIHRLLSNIGAPTSLRNIECIIQEKTKYNSISSNEDGTRDSVSQRGMTADEIIDLIAQIRSI